MGKDLILSSQALQTMLDKAVDNAYDRLDSESINIAGCDVRCILVYEGNIRNEEKGIIALKHYCMQNDINHRVVFDILRDYGWIEYLDNGKKNYSLLTLEGFKEVNGIDEQSSPVITSKHGVIFVDDRDIRFDNFILKIKKHKLYEDSNNGYNQKIKASKLAYSRNEKQMADDLGIIIVEVKEITDESQND